MTPLLRRVLIAALSLPLLLAAPAHAHEADPRIVTVVDEIAPALPEGVVVQAEAGISAQLVAQNPTATVLEVLGTGDRPFLRISRAGVLADVASPDFFTTSNPNGAAPESATTAAPRWVRISAGDSWGWYDHRLHPEALPAPADSRRVARLADFTVPLRLGETATSVRGHVEFRPLLGAFSVTARPGPAGVTVQALPGRLPGLFVSNPQRTPLTVLGRDGEPFVRFSARGVEVNERSRTHVEDRAARGLDAGTPGPDPLFRLVTPGGTSYTWLDARLRYPQDLPPDPVLRASTPTVVQDWTVPVQLAGAEAAFSGQITWVPEAGAGPVTQEDGSADRHLLPYALAAGAALVLSAAVLVLRRRRDPRHRS